MRLLKVAFRNYKILEDNVFEFAENPFYYSAPNETGKTTLIEGIKDAFSLAPARLKDKKTAGKDVLPVLEVTFRIGQEVYHLKINAQDETVSLRGSDGTDLSRPAAIERFWDQKGYHLFPAVLNSLLIIKERDLTVEVTRGLKALMDTVLKSATIEELKKSFENMLIFQKGWELRFRKQSFGKEEKQLRDELAGLKQELEHKRSLFEEYQKNTARLEALKKALSARRKEQEALDQELVWLQKKLTYAEYQHLLAEGERLQKESLLKEQELKGLEAEIKALEEARAQLEQEEEALSQALEGLKELEFQLKEAERELDRLAEQKKLWQRLKEIDQRLGTFKEIAPEVLEQDLLDWQTSRKLSKDSQGLVKVLAAEEEVLVNGERLGPGQAHAFLGQAEISYGPLRLEVYASAALASAREKIARLEATYGTLERLAELKELKRTRETLIFSLKNALGPEEAQKKTEELEEKVKEAKEALKRLLEQKERRKALRLRRKEIEQKLARLRKKAQETALALEKLRLNQTHLAQRLQACEKEIEHLTLKETKLFEAEGGLIPEELRRKIEEKRKRLASLEQEIIALEKEESHLEGLTKVRPDEEELERLLARQKELEERLGRLVRLADILHHGLAVLNTLREEINREYLKRFEEKVAEYFSLITHGNYQGVKFGAQSLFFDGETFKHRWEVTRKDGKVFAIESLSDGTAAQLLLSARLALIRLFFERQAFLLLDEPFAYFDHQRTQKTKALFEALVKEGWQIMVLSAKA